MSGYDQYETFQKRLAGNKFGVNKWWSKKKNGDFFKAVAYTIKCSDYYTWKGFHAFTDYLESLYPWVFGLAKTWLVDDKTKDLDKDWMLT